MAFEFRIEGRLIEDEINDRTLWSARPYSFDNPAVVSAPFKVHPFWRANYDHDGDPATPPIDMGPHKAVDLWSQTFPRQLKPAMPGRVLYAAQSSMSPAGGWKVVVGHDDDGWDGWTTGYLHQEPGSLLVSVGDFVDEDTELGTEDSSGYVTGRHCHFYVRHAKFAAAIGQDPALRGYLDPSMFLRMPGELASAFSTAPREGHTLTTYERGGSVFDFIDAMEELELEKAHITDQGQWVSYIHGAPTFVNAKWLNRFSQALPAGTVMMIGDVT